MKYKSQRLTIYTRVKIKNISIFLFLGIAVLVLLLLPKYRESGYILSFLCVGGAMKVGFDYWAGLPVKIGTTGSVLNFPELKLVRLFVLMLALVIGVIGLLLFFAMEFDYFK